MLFRFESKKKKKKKKKCKKSKHHSSFQWRWQEDSPQRIYRIYKYLSLSLSSHQISLLLQQIQTPKQNPSLDIQPSSHVFYSRLWSLLLDSCFIISWMSMSLSLFSLSFWTSFLRSYNLYNDVWIWDETKRKTIQRKNEENNLWRQQIVFLRKLFSELLLFLLSEWWWWCPRCCCPSLFSSGSRFWFCSCLRMKLLEFICPVLPVSFTITLCLVLS